MPRLLRRLLSPLACLALLFACDDEADDPGLLLPSPRPSASAGSSAAPQAGSAGSRAGSAGLGGAGASGAAPTEDAQILFPTPRALFEKAFVPSCSLNQGQCHNGWAAPDLSSFEALSSLFGAPCQTAAGNPLAVVNECEPAGDLLLFGDGTQRRVLAVIVPDDAPAVPSHVVLFLDGDPGSGSISLRQPGPPPTDRPLDGAKLSPLENGAFRLDLSALPGAYANLWDVREWPRPAAGVHEADPNGDGILGSSLGWRQISPGDPDRSYLYQRLRSDRLGSRMPLVPGSWSPEATRATYCFILNQTQTPIDPDSPIDFAGCPDDLSEITGFSAVASISKNRCAIPGCHSAATSAASLDLTPTPQQFAKVIAALSSQKNGAPLVLPGDAAASYLYCKVDPACSQRAPGTSLMPRGLSPLSPVELQRLADWINAGAKLD